MATDDFSPIYQGDTGVPFSPQFLHKDGTPVNLTGATITMKMQVVGPSGAVGEPVGTIITCGGTWTIDDAVNGRTHYNYQASDVASPGIRNIYIVITIAGQPVHADVKQLVVLPAP